MFDMMTPISTAEEGDIITLKRMIKAEGYIISGSVPLYFKNLDNVHQYVNAYVRPDFNEAIKISLRVIKSIVSPTGVIKYQADSRDIVYGQ